MAIHLLIKRGRFYFRRRLPQVLAASTGRSEIVKALPVCTRPEAVVLARYASARLDAIMKQAMNGMKLDKHQLDAIVREIFEDVLAEYDRTRKLQWNEDGATAAQRRHEGAVEQLRMGFVDNAQEFACEALARAGISLEPTSPAFQELCHKTLRAFSEATRIHLARYEGDFTAQPLDPLFTAPVSPAVDLPLSTSLSLSEAYSKYKEDKEARGEWRADAIRENKNSYDLVIEFFGDRPILEIQKAEIAGFRELLQVLPKLRGKTGQLKGKSLKELVAITKANTAIPRLSATTVGKHMKNLSAFLGWAEQQGFVQVNVARGVHRPSGRKRDVREERNAWTPDQLNQWFTSPFYKGCRSEKRRRLPGDVIVRDHFYWIPLLATFHPLRAEEIAQLFVTDIKRDGDVLYIDVDGGLDADEVEKAGKQVKSHAARRRVPLHALVLNLGFADYVSEQTNAGSSRLFPLLTQGGAAGRFSQYFCRRFGEHIRYFGITGVSFHGLRHSAITALSEGNPNPDVTNELAGHKIGGERGRYRKGASLPTLKAAIDSIAFPGITADLFAGAKAP